MSGDQGIPARSGIAEPAERTAPQAGVSRRTACNAACNAAGPAEQSSHTEDLGSSSGPSGPDLGRHNGDGRPLAARPTPRLAIPLGVLCVFAVLFVLGDVLERRLFPDLSTGWHHGFLTLRAALATIVASLVVYLTMRRQERELSKTAGQLSRLLESYEADRSSPGHFENPHLRHCREVLDCSRKDCVMYDQPQDRCWQIKALKVTDGASNGPKIQIQQCHSCKVYRAAWPASVSTAETGLRRRSPPSSWPR